VVVDQIKILKDIIACHEKTMEEYRLELARLNRQVHYAKYHCYHDFSFDSDVCHLCGETK
jgi:hypothetical protein